MPADYVSEHAQPIAADCVNTNEPLEVIKWRLGRTREMLLELEVRGGRLTPQIVDATIEKIKKKIESLVGQTFEQPTVEDEDEDQADAAGDETSDDEILRAMAEHTHDVCS